MSKAAAVRALIAACLAATALTPALAQAREDRDYGDYNDDRRDDGYYDARGHDDRDHDDRVYDDRERGGMHDMAHKLRDPVIQAKAAAMLSALTGSVLSMDVSPLTRAMDSLDGGHRAEDRPGSTVGDMAGRNARELPYEIARKTPQAMGRMAGMIDALNGMTPQLKEMGRTLKRQLREQGLSDN